MPSLSDSQREGLLAELGALRKFCLSLTGSAADADDLLQVTVEEAALADEEFMDVFHPGDHGSTFGGNSVAKLVVRSGRGSVGVSLKDRMPLGTDSTSSLKGEIG